MERLQTFYTESELEEEVMHISGSASGGFKAQMHHLEVKIEENVVDTARPANSS